MAGLKRSHDIKGTPFLRLNFAPGRFALLTGVRAARQSLGRRRHSGQERGRDAGERSGKYGAHGSFHAHNPQDYVMAHPRCSLLRPARSDPVP